MKTKLTIIASTLVLMVSLSGFVFLTNANYKTTYATSSNNIYHSMCFNPIVNFMDRTGNPDALVGNVYDQLKPGASLTHLVDLNNRNTNVPYKVSLLMTAAGPWNDVNKFLFRAGSPISVTADIHDSNDNVIANSSQTLNFTPVTGNPNASTISFNFGNVVLSGGANATYKVHVTYNWPNNDQSFTTFTRYNGNETLNPIVSDQLDTTTSDLSSEGICVLNYTSDDLFQNNNSSMIYAITFTQS